MTHTGVAVIEAVRVGHNLQEDVHLVEDGGKSGVTSIISHNLLKAIAKDITFSAAGLWSEAAETAKKNPKTV